MENPAKRSEEEGIKFSQLLSKALVPCVITASALLLLTWAMRQEKPFNPSARLSVSDRVNLSRLIRDYRLKSGRWPDSRSRLEERLTESLRKKAWNIRLIDENYYPSSVRFLVEQPTPPNITLTVSKP